MRYICTTIKEMPTVPLGTRFILVTDDVTASKSAWYKDLKERNGTSMSAPSVFYDALKDDSPKWMSVVEDPESVRDLSCPKCGCASGQIHSIVSGNEATIVSVFVVCFKCGEKREIYRTKFYR